MLKKNMFNTLFVLSIFFLDRISKFLIAKSSELSGELNISILPFLNFNIVWNNGIAFGLFPFKDNFYYSLLTLIIVLVTLIIIWLALKSRGLEKISYLMIVGAVSYTHLTLPTKRIV